MNCENSFCVYQEDGICVLREIELDIQGQCKDCIYVDIEEESLQKVKQIQRKRLAAEDGLSWEDC